MDVDDDGHPQHVRFVPLPDLKGDTLRVWVRKALDPDTHLVTDAFASLGCAGAPLPTRRSWSAHANPARSMRSAGSIPSFPTSRPRSGAPYHHVNLHKYLVRHFAEAQYRPNRRFDLPSLVARLLHASVPIPPSPEKWLRLGAISTAGNYLAEVRIQSLSFIRISEPFP